MPRIREAMRSGWKTSIASSFSPVEANMIGRPVTLFTESAAPPRASPSSLVRTRPSMSIRSWKAIATATACWPVIASSTSSESVGFAASRTRPSSSIRSSSTWMRPAVSTMIVSSPSARARSSPERTASTGIGRVRTEDGNVDLPAELLELVDRGGTLEVGRDQPRLAAVRLEPAGELGGGRRLAGALKAGEQDDRLALQLELGGLRAEELGQLLVDDLHDLLACVQPLGDLLVQRPLAHARDEVVDDLEVDVGLDQREPDLAHRARDRLLVEAPALAQAAERGAEPFGKGVEHRQLSVDGPLRSRAMAPSLGLEGRKLPRGAIERDTATEQIAGIPAAELAERRERLLDHVRGAELSGYVLFDASYIQYFTGFWFLSNERPVIYAESADGDSAIFVPEFEVERTARRGRFRANRLLPGVPRNRSIRWRSSRGRSDDLGIRGTIGADNDGYPGILGYKGPIAERRGRCLGGPAGRRDRSG